MAKSEEADLEITLAFKRRDTCPHCLGPALLDHHDTYWCLGNMERSEFPCRFTNDREPVEAILGDDD